MEDLCKLGRADDCPVCFCLLSPPSISLPCGHVFHKNCLEQLIAYNIYGASGGLKCPSCRTPIDVNRLKGAREVCGRPSENGGGYPHYAQRSKAPEPPAPPAALASQQLTELLQRMQRMDLSASRAAAPQPSADKSSAQLLLPRQQRPQAAPFNPNSLFANVPPVPGQRLRLQVAPGNPTSHLMAVLQQEQQQSTHSSDPTELLNSVLPHIAAPPAEPSGSNHFFCLDISASMGDPNSSSPRSCSRLALALAYLACYIDRAVAEGDDYSVACFSSTLHTIVPWQRKGAPGEFDRKQFMQDCRQRVSALVRGSTNLFTVFAHGYHMLQERSRVAAVARDSQQGAGAGAAQPVDSAGATGSGAVQQGAGRGAAPDVSQLRTQQLVLLTDGEATDPEAFERAYQLACSPPVDFDFKSFLVKIDRTSSLYSGPTLSSLARFTDGSAIPYVLYQEIHLPSRVDSRSVATQQTMASLRQAQTTYISSLTSSRHLASSRA